MSDYYGLPILKRPFWKWEIALYFFAEGISAGSYILSTMAQLRGKNVRGGRYLPLLFILPCPPLLIADLGRPERFHHMLRMWKWTSPMNHGAWALSGYGLFAGLRLLLPTNRVSAVAGLPFAFTMVSYPGVLLSTTSIPVWAKTHYLGALFAASSMGSGAAALTVTGGESDTLARFEDVASAVEAIALAAYLRSAGTAARPLVKGKQSKLFWIGAVGIGLVAPAILRRSRMKKLAPWLTIAGSLALKWSITYAGQSSYADRDEAVWNAKSIAWRGHAVTDTAVEV